MQTRKQSMIEVLTGTSLGFVGSWIITFLVLLYVHDKFIAPTMTVILCTVWSLVRGYFIRRHFNGKQNPIA